MKSALLIEKRFLEERENIRSYLEFFENKAGIIARDVKEADELLIELKIEPIIRQELDGTYCISEADLAAIAPHVEAAENALDCHLIRVKEQRAACPKPDKAAIGEHTDLYDEFSGEMMVHLPRACTQDDFDSALHQAIEKHRHALAESTIRTVHAEAVKDANKDKLTILEGDIGMAYAILADIKMLARTQHPAAEINTLRQCFILLMTAFDAAVFDLVRIALRADFFNLIQAFDKGDKERVSLADIGAAGSFEAFRSSVIESQLKRRYLKDLLFLVQSFGIAVTKAPSDFPRLIETVLRRNLHIHNRGIVDARYLDIEGGKPKYNLFNLSLGDVAVITQDYWQNVLRLTGDAIDIIATWVKGLANSHE